MAAGASTPELLCTLVSLFITHSSLGLGTIVGSEIFNQLIICAGSVYASKTHRGPCHGGRSGIYGDKYLVLDKTMVIREVGFYGLSIFLLYVALSESRLEMNNGNDGGEDDNVGEAAMEYIYISFGKACLLLGGYILYVVVCANMDVCIRFFGILQKYVELGGSQSHDDNSGADQQLDNNSNEETTDHNGSVHYKVIIHGYDSGQCGLLFCCTCVPHFHIYICVLTCMFSAVFILCLT